MKKSKSTWHSRQKCTELRTEINTDLSPCDEVQISEIEDERKGTVQSNNAAPVCHQEYGEDMGF
jgi:hypothetical protein